MRHTIIIALLLITLFPKIALAQWGFDAVSVEAYINDHKKQRSLLLARSTLEYSNQLLMVLDNINNSLDLIEKQLNQAYFQTWRYVQLRMGYWKEKVYRTRTKEEILEDAFSRWKVAGKLDY